jgi:hypothetical protein
MPEEAERWVFTEGHADLERIKESYFAAIERGDEDDAERLERLLSKLASSRNDRRS